MLIEIFREGSIEASEAFASFFGSFAFQLNSSGILEREYTIFILKPCGHDDKFISLKHFGASQM